MNERKEPSVSGLEHVEREDRIPTLKDLVAPDGGAPRPAQAPEAGDSDSPSAPLAPEAERAGGDSLIPSAAEPVDEAEIENAADRILDQLAPILRDRIAEALEELLGSRGRH